MSVWVDPNCGRMVARIIGNQTTVLDQVAAQIAAKARGLAASHNQTGEFMGAFSTIRTPGESGVEDRAIVNDHPWAASIEFGHWDPKHKRRVSGIHVLKRAAG